MFLNYNIAGYAFKSPPMPPALSPEIWLAAYHPFFLFYTRLY